MNKQRRKVIANLIEAFEALQAELEEVAAEEEEAFSNIPESLEGTERYEASEAANDALQSALYSLEELLEYLDEARQ
jgi:formiminotetrahydrofolate cyclodeaminase